MYTMYKIVRINDHGGKRTIKTGLTLEEAQRHCCDPETSSRTCTPQRTRHTTGQWFDAYYREDD